MDVMCIVDVSKKPMFTGRNDGERRPFVGEVCTVNFVEDFFGEKYYDLLGFITRYNVKYFAPLSEIDETERLNKEEHAYA